MKPYIETRTITEAIHEWQITRKYHIGTQEEDDLIRRFINTLEDLKRNED